MRKLSKPVEDDANLAGRVHGRGLLHHEQFVTIGRDVVVAATTWRRQRIPLRLGTQPNACTSVRGSAFHPRARSGLMQGAVPMITTVVPEASATALSTHYRCLFQHFEKIVSNA
jgi:hypothetical protein